MRATVALLALVCSTASAEGWFTAVDLPQDRLELNSELVLVDDRIVIAAVRMTNKASGAQMVQSWSVQRASCFNGGGEISMSLIDPVQKDLPPMQFTVRRRGDGGSATDLIGTVICDTGARRAWGGRVWR